MTPTEHLAAITVAVRNLESALDSALGELPTGESWFTVAAMSDLMVEVHEDLEALRVVTK